MEYQEVVIELYDKREKVISKMLVLQLSDNIFRMTDNAIFNCSLTFGTEFATRLNKEGLHEVIKILKKSPFITRRFFLNSQFTAADYCVLGDEIMKAGGFWQVDFGGIATVNLPKESDINLDEIFKIFNFHPGEIVE